MTKGNIPDDCFQGAFSESDLYRRGNYSLVIATDVGRGRSCPPRGSVETSRQ